MEDFTLIRNYFDLISYTFRTDFYEALESNDLEKAYDILFNIEENLDARDYEVRSLVNFGRQTIETVGLALNEMKEGHCAPSLRSMKTLNTYFSDFNDE